jgi:hypothetical protein
MKIKINNRPEIVIIAILILTISILWAYLNIFKTLRGESEKPILTPQETRKINPSFDQEVFELLKKRRQ